MIPVGAGHTSEEIDSQKTMLGPETSERDHSNDPQNPQNEYKSTCMMRWDWEGI
jgi:hypothetical protein